MRKFKFGLIALVVLQTFIGAKVWAQDQTQGDESTQVTPSAVSSTDLEALNERIDALEKNVSSELQVHGWLQFWYTQDSYGTTAAGTSNDYTSSKNQWDSFSVKRATLVLSGEVAQDPKIQFVFSIDPSQSSFNGLGGSAGSTLVYEGTSKTTTNVNPFTLVKDLYTTATYSPYASFIVGQNKLWNPLEGRTSAYQLDFNNYSNVDGGAFGNKRDLGIALSGSNIPLGALQAEYYLTVIQGSGQSTFDNNVDKDLAGRVGLRYDKNLYVGASAYDGWEVYGVRQYVGLEGSWTLGGFKTQAEFLTGSVNTNDNNSANNSSWTPSLPTVKGFVTPGGQITPSGYYVQASYRLGDWRLGARLDGYNFNQQGAAGGSNQEWDTYTVGLDWFQAKDAYKLTANWEDHLLSGTYAYTVWTIQSQIYI